MQDYLLLDLLIGHNYIEEVLRLRLTNSTLYNRIDDVKAKVLISGFGFTHTDHTNITINKIVNLYNAIYWYKKNDLHMSFLYCVKDDLVYTVNNLIYLTDTPVIKNWCYMCIKYNAVNLFDILFTTKYYTVKDVFINDLIVLCDEYGRYEILKNIILKYMNLSGKYYLCKSEKVYNLFKFSGLLLNEADIDLIIESNNMFVLETILKDKYWSIGTINKLFICSIIKNNIECTRMILKYIEYPVSKCIKNRLNNKLSKEIIKEIYLHDEKIKVYKYISI